MAHYTLTVPVKFDDNGIDKTRYQRVGVVFENTRQGTGEKILSIRLDFPVGATELVAFTPKQGDISQDQGA